MLSLVRTSVLTAKQIEDALTKVGRKYRRVRSQLNGITFEVGTFLHEHAIDLSALELRLEVDLWLVKPTICIDTNTPCTLLMRCAPLIVYGLATYEARDHSDAISQESEIRVKFGLRDGRFLCGLTLDKASPGSKDINIRANLFISAIELMHLTSYVEVHMEAGRLTLLAKGGSQLWFPVAEIDGGNPAGFEVRGLPSLELASECVRRFLSSCSKGVHEMEVFLKTKPDNYPGVCEQLAHCSPWLVDVFARYKQGFELTPQGLDRCGVSRVPVLSWFEDNEDTIFSCYIVRMSDGLGIEVVSNTDMSRTLTTVKTVTAVEFMPDTSMPHDYANRSGTTF